MALNIKELLFGGGNAGGQFNRLNPQQEKALSSTLGQYNPEQASLQGNQLYQTGSSYLNNLLQGGPGAYDKFSAPYLRQFNEELAPALAERYTAQGAKGSSSFNNAFAKEASNLEERLASLHGGLQLQALPQALQFAQQPFSNQLSLGQLGLGTNAYEQQGQFVPGGGNQGLVGGLSSLLPDTTFGKSEYEKDDLGNVMRDAAGNPIKKQGSDWTKWASIGLKFLPYLASLF